ncbi:MAG: Na+/H+ antiporter, partial [bacterium]
MEQTLIGPEIQFLTLLTIAALISVVVKYVRLPYTIALVIGGLFVGLTGIGPYRLTEEMILFAFLPPLLFEGAIHFEISDLKRNMRTIAVLALPGLLIAGFTAGFLLQRLTGLPFIVALLVGVMITPTDPISVLALFKRLGVSKRLSMIMEGESVFNDGTGIVLYGVLVGIITSGTFSLGSSVLLFLKVVIGGLIVGIIAGQVAFMFLKKLDDHVLEVLITIILAFGSFMIAEHTLNVSGVMAVVAAGVLIGNQGTRHAMSPTTRIAIKNFWEIAAFIINSLIFLMIGTQIDPGELFLIWPSILAAFLIVVAARAVGSYPMLALLNLAGERIPIRWTHVINWGGIHGSIPIALALGLPDIPQRDFIVSLVFGVVFLSLTVQGLTMSLLIRFLGLAGRDEKDELYERAVARTVIINRSLEDLKRKKIEGRISPATATRLTYELEEELRKAGEEMVELETTPEVITSRELMLRRSLLMLQKSTLSELLMEGEISHDTAEELARRLDHDL